MIKHIKTFCDEYKISVNADGVITLSAGALQTPSVIRTTGSLQVFDELIPGDIEVGAVRILDAEYSDRILDLNGLIKPESANLVPTIGVVETYVSGRLGESGEVRSENGEVILSLTDATQYAPASMTVIFGSENFYITETTSSINGMVVQAQEPFAGVSLSNYGGISISPVLRLKFPTSDSTEVDIHEDGLLSDSISIYAKPNSVDTGLYFGTTDGTTSVREELASSRRALVYGIIF